MRIRKGSRVTINGIGGTVRRVYGLRIACDGPLVRYAEVGMNTGPATTVTLPAGSLERERD